MHDPLVCVCVCVQLWTDNISRTRQSKKDDKREEARRQIRGTQPTLEASDKTGSMDGAESRISSRDPPQFPQVQLQQGGGKTLPVGPCKCVKKVVS